MDSELDEILDSLPRCNGTRDSVGRGATAKVYIDDSGRLCILLKRGGWLALAEKNHAYLESDVAPFSD